MDSKQILRMFDFAKKRFCSIYVKTFFAACQNKVQNSKFNLEKNMYIMVFDEFEVSHILILHYRVYHYD